MITEEFDFFSKGGTKIHAKCWLPDQQPTAIICIVQDIFEHTGYYEELAAFFVEHRIAIYTHDHRGFGRSEGKRGHASVSLLLEDVQELIISARKDYNDTPIFLLGHGIGGNLVANFLIKYMSGEISGAIINAGTFKIALEITPLQEKISQFLFAFWPAITVRHGITSEMIYADHTSIQKMASDPLLHDKISMRLLFDLNRAGKFAMQNAALIELPILVTHGEHDKISALKTSQEFAIAAGDNATHKIWKDAMHQCHLDTNGAMHWDFYLDWITNMLK